MGKKRARETANEVVPLPDCSTDPRVVTCEIDEEEIEMTAFEHVMGLYEKSTEWGQREKWSNRSASSFKIEVTHTHAELKHHLR